MKKLQAPRGTFDVLPRTGAAGCALVHDRGRACSGRAGYEPFETPVFEDTELFARGVGESTDIVQKEMFTFEDKGGRSLTLRPEGTAGVCRAYVEHGMHKLPQPVKLWYRGPFFRHEAPQAGRFRQFTQVGAEALGSDDPSLDAELILLLAELLERAGTGRRGCRLSSLGTPRRARRLPRGAARLPARARGRAVRRGARAARPEPAARVRRRPPGHPGGDGRRAAAARPARRRRRRALRARCARCSTPPGSPTRSTRRSCAASTTTRARCSSSSPSALGAQAASAAAAATTAWSRSWAGRRRRASAGRRGSSGSCWRRERSAEQDRGRRVRGDRPSPSAAEAFALVGALRERRRARRDGAGRPLAEGPAEAGRPARRARWMVIVGDEIEVKDMETGAAARGEPRTRSLRMVGTRVKPPRAEPLPRRLGRRAARRRRGRARSAWPAGCTAAATTAG